jgi:hypothetical protein
MDAHGSMERMLIVNGLRPLQSRDAVLVTLDALRIDALQRLSPIFATD